MAIVTRTLILTGGRAGKTVRLSKKYQFRDGKIVLRGPSHKVECIARMLAINYAAFEEGSRELEAAHGQRDLSESPIGEQEHALSSEVQSEGSGSGAEAAADLDGHGDADSGDSGLRSEGDGHEDSRSYRIREALTQLDMMNDEHWTRTGLPAVKAVEELLGEPVKRVEIEEATPGLVREG
ncbi:MAG: hypothetical protein GY906_28285 [bacterium]|nr:hypothetical protein [bacterium]